MRSDQVTRRQARIVKNRLESTRDYLIKLHQRMAKTGFNADDERMALDIAADLAIHNLCNDLQLRVWDGPTAPPARASDAVPQVDSPRTVEMRERMK